MRWSQTYTKPYEMVSQIMKHYTWVDMPYLQLVHTATKAPPVSLWNNSTLQWDGVWLAPCWNHIGSWRFLYCSSTMTIWCQCPPLTLEMHLCQLSHLLCWLVLVASATSSFSLPPPPTGSGVLLSPFKVQTLWPLYAAVYLLPPMYSHHSILKGALLCC